MLATLAKGFGQLLGETVHQTDKAMSGTAELAADLVEDISNIPNAFSEGYDEELFATAVVEDDDKSTKSDSPFK